MLLKILQKYTSSAGWGRGTALSTRLEDVGSTGGGGSAASTRVTGTVPRRDNAAPLNPRLGRVAPTRYRWERTGASDGGMRQTRSRSRGMVKRVRQMQTIKHIIK